MCWVCKSRNGAHTHLTEHPNGSMLGASAEPQAHGGDGPADGQLMRRDRARGRNASAEPSQADRRETPVFRGHLMQIKVTLTNMCASRFRPSRLVQQGFSA